MNTKVLKYILDIESVIAEIEQLLAHVNSDYSMFLNHSLAKRAAERQLEIIGEAVGKLSELNPDLKITGSEKMVSLRNLIVHAYDSIDDEIIWSVIQKDVPVLKEELKEIRNSNF